MKKASLLAVLALFTSCSSCEEVPPPEEEVVLECGDERADLGRQRQPIVNGDPSFDPEIVQLMPGQMLAVGAIMQMYGGSWTNMCTGTLVAPATVLTAAHCVVDRGSVTPASRLAFGIGEDVSRGEIIRASEVHAHPYYNYRTGRNDVALILLQEDARDVVEEIVPLPYNCTTLGSDDLLGQWVQTVGYGCIDSYCRQQNTRRWWATEKIVDVSASHFTVDGFGVQGVCFGDSGGPALWTMPTGELRVIGTLHGGDSDCGNQDWYPATFDSCEFLISHAEGCGEVTAEGRCEGEVLTYCDEDGQVVTIDCSLHAEYCGEDDSGVLGCLEEPPEPDPCEGITWEGACEGDDAVWCENETIMRRRCADCNQSCGYVSGEGVYYCVD